MIESPELYPYLTGYENLLLLSRINGESCLENINPIVELVQLGDRIHDKVKTYSLGMRQRLGVAQAQIEQVDELLKSQQEEINEDDGNC